MDLASLWACLSSPQCIGLFIAIVLVASRYFKFGFDAQKARKLPPGPRPLPILGNLLAMGASPHRSLSLVADKYGPICYIRLGSVPTVVVSSSKLAKEVLFTKGHLLTQRPMAEFGKRLFYGEKGLLMMPYNAHWRNLRKICALELLSNKKVQELRHVWDEEVSSSLLCIREVSQRGKAIDLTSEITSLTANTIARIVMTERPGATSTFLGLDFQNKMKELGELIGVPILSDCLPYLKWLDLGGYKQRMDELHHSLDSLFEKIIQERRLERQKHATDESSKFDFLDVLLSASSDGSQSLEHDAIKAMLEDLLGAGTDTLALAIEWIMSEVLLNPQVLKKAQDELDTVVGISRKANELHIPRLHYLRAVIKETFRLHPPAPFVFRQVPRQPCEVAGYHLPRRASVMVNVWAIGRDPATWVSPNQFFPERFIGSNMDVKGHDFELLPFGAGRRICPGLVLAMPVIELAVANLLHSFDWELPSGTVAEEFLRESPGVAIRKAKPLIAFAKARVSSITHTIPSQ